MRALRLCLLFISMALGLVLLLGLLPSVVSTYHPPLEKTGGHSDTTLKEAVFSKEINSTSFSRKLLLHINDDYDGNGDDTGDGVGIGVRVGNGTSTGTGDDVSTGGGIGNGTGTGSGDGVSIGDGVGTGDGIGVGNGNGNGIGTGDGSGIGDGIGIGTGTGDGVSIGGGVGTGDGIGVGIGNGIGTGDGGIGTGDGGSIGDGIGIGTRTGDGIGIGVGSGTGTGDGVSTGDGTGTGDSIGVGGSNGTGGGVSGGDGGPMNRIGTTCSKDNIVVFQGQTTPLPNGIPTYTVQIQNACSTGCSISNIHLSCGWFSSARMINPRLFRRVYYNDCLVNNGEALYPGQSLSFQYANSFSYPLSVSSVACT